MSESTIFDDVLRTIQERLPQLLVPLVNEVFHTSYSKDTEVVRLPEEYQKLLSKVLYHLSTFYQEHLNRGDTTNKVFRLSESYIQSSHTQIKKLFYQ